MNLLTLRDPVGGEPLTADSPHSVAAGGERWPVADGVPYLRAGRDEIRNEALRRLDAGDADGGLAVLLTDQDPFAPLPPPSVADCRALVADVRAGACGLREAMRRLNFGPVADYFAVRPSTPTFLSGLGLLSQYGGDRPVVGVACGIGQLLREPCRRGLRVAGTDLVFSKLWLARRFVVPRAELVCGDVCGGPFAVPTTAVTVLCHDAFYFFPDKRAAAQALAALAGTGGRVLVGHAHSANWDHGGVAGNLLTPEGYAALFPGCLTFADAAFTAALLSGVPAEPEHPAALGDVEAVSLAWQLWGELPAGPPDRYADPVEGAELVLNPLLEPAGGRLVPRWPSPRFAAEYRSADYLAGEPLPPDEVLRCAAQGNLEYLTDARVHRPETSAEVSQLARRRILLPRGDVI
jgi:SAM-dependent methyltransferase